MEFVSAFPDKLVMASDASGGGLILSVGLDSAIDQLPAWYEHSTHPRFAFNKDIIDQTARHAGAYKPNMGFYGGPKGFEELQMTVDYIRRVAPQALVILDAKRGDIGSSSDAYAADDLDALGADAITLSPYLGKRALDPYFKRPHAGMIILCRTSNPGANEFQDLTVTDPLEGDQIPLYRYVARQVDRDWKASNGNRFMLVVGATYPQEALSIRQDVNHMSFLIPGIGRQGGDLQAIIDAVVQDQSDLHIINSARDIIFAQNPAEAAAKLHRQIQEAHEARLEALAKK